MEDNHTFLPLFITEDIYVLKKEAKAVPTTPPPSDQKETEEPVETVVEEPQIVYHGENNKNVLLLVQYEEHQHIAPTDASFLEKILGAVKLSFADVAIVNLSHHQKSDYIQQLNTFRAETVISFDVSHQDLLYIKNTKRYEIVNQGNKKVLVTDTLATIASDNDKKRKLWDNLQKLFL